MCKRGPATHCVSVHGALPSVGPHGALVARAYRRAGRPQRLSPCLCLGLPDTLWVLRSELGRRAWEGGGPHGGSREQARGGPEAQLRPRTRAHLPRPPTPRPGLRTHTHAPPIGQNTANTNSPTGMCSWDMGASGTRWPVPSGMARNPSWGAPRGRPTRRLVGPHSTPQPGTQHRAPTAPTCSHPPLRGSAGVNGGEGPRTPGPHSPRAP